MRTTSSIRRTFGLGLAAVLFFAACGSDDSTDTADSKATVVTDAPPVTDSAPTSEAPAEGAIAVPADYATIQEAVDAAVDGDLILISPGTYHEAVNVGTDNLTIRGLDRNTVILDGEFTLDNGIRVLGANGVAIENMTAMNYTNNGFFWTGVSGYRGSYLTAWRNGDYGVYAFDSVKGQLDNSYAAGSPDAGFYIGECYPCDSVIDNVVSEHNGLGYSGTNSGGNLLIVNSRFNNNRAGVVPNSGSYELCYPERETTIVGNLVYSNNQPDTPAIDVAILAMGNGILSAGGVANTIERNQVWDHNRLGIGLVPFLEDGANDDEPTPEEWATPCSETKNQPPAAVIPDSILWDSKHNVVRENVLSDNRLGDIGIGSAGTDLGTLGNCFEGNTYEFTSPADLDSLAPCGYDIVGDLNAGSVNVAAWLVEQATMPPSVDYKTATLPDMPVLENMPNAATAPANPATNVPFAIDLAAIKVPAKPV
ncbi:hypothetical protein BH10ACT2_BH10ACT2_15300 [soil metagenome]